MNHEAIFVPLKLKANPDDIQNYFSVFELKRKKWSARFINNLLAQSQEPISSSRFELFQVLSFFLKAKINFSSCTKHTGARFVIHSEPVLSRVERESHNSSLRSPFQKINVQRKGRLWITTEWINIRRSEKKEKHLLPILKLRRRQKFCSLRPKKKSVRFRAYGALLLVNATISEKR